MARNALIQVRRDTAANWTSVNPTLASGEIGLETDTGRYKMGNGTTPWNSLGIDLTVDTLVADSISATNQVEGDVLISYAGTSVGTDLSVGNDLEVANNVTINGANLTIGLGTVIADSLYAQTSIQLSGDDVALNRSLPIKTAADVNGAATYWRSPFYSGSSTSLISTTLGQGVGSPFVFDTSVTISEIGFRTGSSTPSTQIKFLIYSCGAGTSMPLTLEYTSSAVTTTAANTSYSVTGLSVSLPPGIYWIFIFNSQAGTMSYFGNLASVAFNSTPFQTLGAAVTNTNNNSAPNLVAGSSTPTPTLTYGSTLLYSGSWTFPYIAIRRSA